VEKALFGVGGAEILGSLETLRYEARGVQSAAGEGIEPDAEIDVGGFADVVSLDLAQDRVRVEGINNGFLFGNTNTFQFIIDGDLGAGVGSESAFGTPLGALLSDRVASVKRELSLLSPYGFLKALAEDPSLATDEGLVLIDGIPHHALRLGEGPSAVWLDVSAHTGRLSRLRTTAAEPLYCDVAVEVHFIDWKSTEAGLWVPSSVLMSVDGHLVHEEARSNYAVNSAVQDADFAFPEGVEPEYIAEDAERGAAWFPFLETFGHLGVPLEGAQTFVSPTELAPGVFLLGGGTHNSMAVEQSNGVVLFDPVLYPARSAAIKEWVQAQFPNKPITHVVISHHHTDHVGGVREFIADGVTLVVSEHSADYFRDLGRASCEADPTQETPDQPARLLTVPEDGVFTLADDLNPVEVYDVDNGHAGDLVFPYVPSSGVLFIVDVYSPGLQPFPLFANQARDSIDELELNVSVIAGGHGGTSTLEAFDQVLGR
jgi:glyoxylase-like metal-dependent hydrolase (beta-lactamase superfamily II)